MIQHVLERYDDGRVTFNRQNLIEEVRNATGLRGGVSNATSEAILDLKERLGLGGGDVKGRRNITITWTPTEAVTK